VAASSSSRLRARSWASSGLRHTTSRSPGKCALVSSLDGYSGILKHGPSSIVSTFHPFRRKVNGIVLARDLIQNRAAGSPWQAMTAVETIRQLVLNRKSRGSCPRQTVVYCSAAELWRNVLSSCPSPIPYQSPNSDLFRNVKRPGNGTSSGNDGGSIYNNLLGSCVWAFELPPRRAWI
jgi:hypothetical protein